MPTTHEASRKSAPPFAAGLLANRRPDPHVERMTQGSLDTIDRPSVALGRCRAAPVSPGPSRPAVPWGALALLVLGSSMAEGQEYRFEDADGPGVEIGRSGTAIVVDAAGPALFGRREFYRPVPPLQLRNRWIVVQDSTLGLVFAAPSGVKPDVEAYDGDVHLRSLQGVTAVEVRALVFNVWGELTGYLGVTVLIELEAGDAWDSQPRWADVLATAHAHRTSIMWINRVMFDDESILEADMAPVATAWSYVTGSEFDGLPEDSLLDAIGL